MTTLEMYVKQLKQQGALCHFIYDMDALVMHLENVTAQLPKQCEMYYAMKANSESPLLAEINPRVAGFEVASEGELAKALEHTTADRIIFGGPGKTEDSLLYAVQQGIRRIHVESVLELERLNMLLERENKTMSILLRVNLAGPFPGATLHMAGQPTQFGIDESDVDSAIAMALQMPRIQLDGFHFHSISNHLDAKRHLAVMALYFKKAKAWATQHQFTLQHLNVGGGIGVNYADLSAQFDWTTFTSQLARLIEQEQLQQVTLNFECGRYLVAHSGYYVTEVLDLKRVHGHWFAVLKGGTQHFRLPVSWQHQHPFRILTMAEPSSPLNMPSIQQQPVTLVGQLCTPKDVFAKDIMVPKLTVGDVIIFEYAGAYGWSISHHDFLSHPHPQFIYWSRKKEEE
ncbi:type III PLP-dependent enzyme [Staphylococcus lutrae]|uniref:Diaminopimelate decarboxylase n=1 Tax=Staphylococcus lutrae TaxID=155085 RepID=A0AAC9RSY3_9STAP|nr:type III PLP-dependent enzyme [Staphylococcus lutrae]ARJ51184.1 diaminopimelate decarboxylase [Staphylococcus lutrae]PNZ39429.1 type III PLP-dependent enzyme [Staphylococcus lutrae]